MMPVDVCEGAEPVVLYLEQPVRVIEPFGQANERIGRIGWQAKIPAVSAYAPHARSTLR